MNYLFISGLIRSGTTLLTRVLGVHHKIAVASDPYFPIYKSFLHELKQIHYSNSFDLNDPIDDYYFQVQNFRRFLRNTSLSYNINLTTIEKLKEEIKIKGYLSPAIFPELNELSGHNYKELLESGFNIIKNVYGNKHTEWIGFKEGWLDELAPNLLDAFPSMKVIFIKRDPRAICPSIRSTGAYYPYLFMLRHWRKSIVLSYIISNDVQYKDRVLNIKYEDLVTNPEKVVKKITNFLNIDYDPKMINPEYMTDGAKRKWKQNTFLTSPSYKITKKSKDHWKKILSEDEAKIIEYMCFPEMKMTGYQPQLLSLNKSNSIDYDFINLLFEEENSFNWAEWLKPNIPSNKKLLQEHIENEIKRIDILRDYVDISDLEKEFYYLDKDFFLSINKLLKNYFLD